MGRFEQLAYMIDGCAAFLSERLYEVVIAADAGWVTDCGHRASRFAEIFVLPVEMVALCSESLHATRAIGPDSFQRLFGRSEDVQSLRSRRYDPCEKL